MSDYPRPIAFLGVGVPGSGKTTYLKLFASEMGPSCHYLCADDFREQLAGDAADQSVNAEAWRMVYDAAETWLGKGESVVIDATHAKHWERRAAVQRYRGDRAATAIAITFEVEIEVALERNKARARTVPEAAIRDMARLLEEHPVTTDEGFDDIIEVRT